MILTTLVPHLIAGSSIFGIGLGEGRRYGGLGRTCAGASCRIVTDG